MRPDASFHIRGPPPTTPQRRYRFVVSGEGGAVLAASHQGRGAAAPLPRSPPGPLCTAVTRGIGEAPAWPPGSQRSDSASDLARKRSRGLRTRP